MAESFNLLRRVRSLDIAPELSGYSGVVIFAGQDEDGNNIEYRAGDRTGTVLEITNEWGSQAQADAIYRKIRGFKYQPYKAGGTSIDPSAEIGDAVTVSDIYSGVFAKKTTFGRHIRTDLEAPSKEEVEHEFQIQSPTNRQYERFTRSVRASLSITASKIAAEVEDRQEADNLLRATLNIHAKEIEAKVSSEVGNSHSDFWWKLLSTGWDAGTGSKTVFSVKKTVPMWTVKSGRRPGKSATGTSIQTAYPTMARPGAEPTVPAHISVSQESSLERISRWI